MREGGERRLAAIVAADVVGWSRLMGGDESGALDALRRCRAELVDPLVARRGGRLVKTMGDGLLLEFPSVVNAAACAIGLQEGMAAGAHAPLRFRVGVHLGDVIVEGDDIFGDGVNVAARIEGLAEPGGVAISDDAHRLVRDRLETPWRDGGEHRVKNIERALWIWRWSPGEAAAGPGGAPPAPEAAAPPHASIAVLPFDNMSGDAEQAYFVDGVVEDLITELSRIPGLHVIARNSSFAFRGRAVRALDVARDLGVAHVLEGSVRRAGGRVRVTAQLIDGRTEGHVWAERYDRDLDDVFAVQDDLVRSIVAAIEPRLGLPEAAPGAVSTEAYDLFLRGRELHRLYTPDGYAAAVALYRRATELDPGYALPWAAMAEAETQQWVQGRVASLEAAEAHARKAAAIDADQALVQTALSHLALFAKDFEGALAAGRRAVELEPGYAEGYAILAGVRHFMGEADAVAPLIETAMRLNPLYPFYYTIYLGQAEVLRENWETGLALFRRSAARNPDSLIPHAFAAVCLIRLGRREEAEAALAEALRVRPDFGLAWLRTYMPYRRAADLERLVGGLREAGLPD